MAFDLSWALLRFHVTVDAVDLREQITGPALRGAIARRVRRATCLTGQPDCEGCGLREAGSCQYALLFEQRHSGGNSNRGDKAASGIVIRTPSWNGVGGSFNVTLIGPAIAAWPALLAAVESLAGGMGISNVPVRLQEAGVLDCEGALRPMGDPWPSTRPARKQGLRLLRVVRSLRTIQSNLGDRSIDFVRMTFVSPTALMHEARLLAAPEPVPLVARLLDRLDNLGHVLGVGPLSPEEREGFERAARSLVTMRCETVWHRSASFSSRQKREVPFEGFVGILELAGEGVQRLAPLFAAVEDLGIGKKTSRGCGECEVQLLAGRPADGPQHVGGARVMDMTRQGPSRESCSMPESCNSAAYAHVEQLLREPAVRDRSSN